MSAAEHECEFRNRMANKREEKRKMQTNVCTYLDPIKDRIETKKTFINLIRLYQYVRIVYGFN